MLRHGAALCSIGFQEPTPGDGLLPLEPVPDWSLSELALKNVELCPPDRQSKLTLDWYGALVSRYIDFDLGEEFLADFENLEEDKALQQLRALAVEADLAQYRKSPDALFPLNSWAWERSLLNSEQIDRYHIARYLLDTKSDLAKVKKAYEKDKKANSPEARAAFYSRVEEALASTFETNLHCVPLPRSETQFNVTWLYYRDRLDGIVVPPGRFDPEVASGFQREFLRVQFVPGLDGLEITAAVQNGQVLAWQQSEPSADPTFWHFYSNLFADIDEQTSVFKSLTSFGLWPIKSGMSAKSESKSLKTLCEQIQLLAPQVFDFYFKQFHEEFFKRQLRWFEECWEEVVPTEALVSFLGDALLLQAFQARSQGNESRAQSWLDAAEESIKRSREGSPVRVHLETRLSDMRGDPKAPLTMMIHRPSMEFLARQEQSAARSH